MPIVKTEKMITPTGEWVARFNCNSSGEFSCKLESEIAALLGKTHIRAGSLDECVSGVREALKAAREAKTTINKVIVFEFDFSADILTQKAKELIDADRHLGPDDHENGYHPARKSDELAFVDKWLLTTRKARFSNTYLDGKEIDFKSYGGDGISLSLSVHIAEETVTESKGKRHFIYYDISDEFTDRLPPSLKGGRMSYCDTMGERPKNVIDWTQEREDFFVSVGEKLDELVYMLARFFFLDTAKIAEFADKADFKAISSVNLLYGATENQ